MRIPSPSLVKVRKKDVEIKCTMGERGTLTEAGPFWAFALSSVLDSGLIHKMENQLKNRFRGEMRSCFGPVFHGESGAQGWNCINVRITALAVCQCEDRDFSGQEVCPQYLWNDKQQQMWLKRRQACCAFWGPSTWTRLASRVTLGPGLLSTVLVCAYCPHVIYVSLSLSALSQFVQ